MTLCFIRSSIIASQPPHLSVFAVLQARKRAIYDAKRARDLAQLVTHDYRQTPGGDA